MTVLDASALVSFLVSEPGRPEVESLLRVSEPPPAMSAVNLAEVVDVLVRLRHVSFDDLLERLTWLSVGGLEIVAADIEIGATAGFLRARHYHRMQRCVSIADCHALATALVLEHPLATSDPHLAAAARDEDVAVVPLPGSTGRRPG